MKKTAKRILIISGIVVGVLVLAFAGMMLKFKYEMRGFTPVETGRVVSDIFVVKDDFANIFIMKDNAQYIVFDCGSTPKEVAKQFEKLGINPNDVAAVFLTHTDGDHVGALNLFNKAKVYMSKEEERMMTEKISKFFGMTNSISRSDYTLLEDRQKVQIGNLKIEGILAPGHTTGTMAYLVNDKYLFTGDVLSLKDNKIAPIPAFFDMDHDQAVKSMEIIRHIPTTEYIFTAHWGYVYSLVFSLSDKELANSLSDKHL